MDVRSLIKNYVSFAGMVITFTSLACILRLFLIDLTQRSENPDFGTVTYRVDAVWTLSLVREVSRS